MVLNILILLFGTFWCSTAVIFIKQCDTHPVLLAGYRQLVAAVALAPFMIRDLRRYRAELTWDDLRVTIVPGVMLGLHFITWIAGARMTPAANASLIVNLVPVAMPFFMLAMVREHITRAELTGTVIALTGMLLLMGADFNLSLTFFWGDLICFVSMLFFCCYLALGRRNRRYKTTLLYVVPLYFAGGLLCVLAAIPFVNPLRVYPGREIVLILALGVLPTVLGHSTLNYVMKRMRGQIMGIINLSQFVFAGILAYVLLGEVPHWTFYAATVLLVAGAVVAVRGTPDYGIKEI